jgi:hypothetical protein
MHRIYSEDILPCLTFPNADVRERKYMRIKLIVFLLHSFHQEYLKLLNKMM